MTLHQLRLFAAVAGEQSFARAAQALYLSEATVSNQVKVLETLVGVRLLERSPGRRQVEVTEAGRILLQGYARAFGELQAALNTIEALHGVEHGSVTFGAGSQFGSSLLPLLCGAFRRDHPGITVSVEIDQRNHLLESLRRHRLDLAVLVDPGDDSELLVEPLAEYEVFLVGPPGHRLAQVEQPARFTELASESLILPGYSGAVRREMERLAAQAGIALNVVLEVVNVETQIQAVTGGVGIAALTSFSLRTWLAAGQVSVLSIQGFPIRLQWHLVLPKDHLSPATATFRDYLLRYVAEVRAASADLGEPARLEAARAWSAAARAGEPVSAQLGEDGPG
jgi:DNA-binding transcriptional LysR family regulator